MTSKEHCDHYVTQAMPSFRVVEGDCTRPVKGRFIPHPCKGVCDRYDDTAYKLKQALNKASQIKGG